MFYPSAIIINRHIFLSYNNPIWLVYMRKVILMINNLIDDVLQKEGGYSNHPHDRGGETNWGITIAVARKYGYNGPMRSMPKSEAHSIYKHIYWLKPQFDKIALLAPKIAAEMFDTGVNMGVRTAISFVQRALNALNRQERDYQDLTIDKVIGPATLKALEQYLNKRGAKGELVLLRAIEALQGERYIRLAEKRSSNESFLYGWIEHRIG